MSYDVGEQKYVGIGYNKGMQKPGCRENELFKEVADTIENIHHP